MIDIQQFVADAKAKGLSDEQIKNALSANGWSAPVIDAALLGLEVPKIESTGNTQPEAAAQTKQPSLSHLMAALLHVLLWFFAGSSTVTIIGVVASLSGYSVSSDVLASMIAVTLITFTPYAILFLLFLIKARRTPGLIPSKVWSIITVCLHSIGAMGAAITLVITLITGGEWSVTLSALLILALNLIMVITYCFATFSPARIAKVRKIVLISHLPILLVLFGTLFIMSLLQLGPAKHDEEVRKNLVKTVDKVRSYTDLSKSLPTSGTDIVVGSDITYRKKDKITYELCADFKTANKSQGYNYYGSSTDTPRDDYAYDTQFYANTSGNHCFSFISSTLESLNNNKYYDSLDESDSTYRKN